jgi:hypothetical protein
MHSTVPIEGYLPPVVMGIAYYQCVHACMCACVCVCVCVCVRARILSVFACVHV